MRYKYQAIDENGQEVDGIISTDNERDAARQLQKRGLTVLNVTSADSKITKIATRSGKPQQRDVLTVLHELTTLLESGVSLIEAIESLAQSSHHPVIVDNFAKMATKLRQGVAFSVTLQKSDLDLPWYLYQLVEAGELTGKVAQGLRDGVEQLEYETKVQSEMRNALIYPSILIFSGITAVLLIFIVVVPRFAGILKNKNAEIPWLAEAVLGTGMFFNNNIGLIAAVGAGIIIAAGYILSQEHVRLKAKDIMARLPIIGVWIMEAETGRWAAMLGTLLENKVPLLRGLELAAQSIQLPSLNARLNQVTKAVRTGTNLSQALQDNDALTATGHNLIRAGEKSGKLPPMLHSLAKLLDESGRTRMKRFLLLIEPLAILVIGSVIGVIITGVILAITAVNQVNF
ncbi:type II secretion system F family protein [Candidatus Albibeggiatoa sp. nov. NOAA]|uniref:type II secretion system F family protein n=1 Tax=Candidatus Albibeggiatoa sp. nov. NOAA TaxID=3162724 RepID=UPI0032FF1975|nr:type II secretion system F family protein [Thiotrichaceae bacterium]